MMRQAVALGFANDGRYLPLFQKHLAMATERSLFWSFVPSPETAGPLDHVP